MKKIFIVIAVILAIFLLLLSIISKKNVTAMNRSIDAALEELNKNYKVTALDPGEYKELKLFKVVKFDVEQYDIESLGNLSVMRVNMGAMQMATVVITPQNKNLPLLSADYMYILSNRKAYLEFYDVVKEKDDQYMKLLHDLDAVQANYKHLDDIAPSAAWYDDLLTVTAYKSGTTEADDDLINLLVDSLHVYLEHGKELPALSEEERDEKLALTRKYTDGLIKNGGVSTDVFKKQLGNEVTKEFFDNVFFGTAVK